ncbi:DUF805 domain-containing protein [Candidatus Thioglobus sp.]|nr:DUF805 domain-containing protein [Candidatus Thioglobus sp.]
MIFLQPYKKYAVFSGRASRKEFWFFHLFYIIGFIVLMSIQGMFDGAGVSLFWILVNIIPQTAVGVRRLHDTNKSGWMYLFILIPFGNLLLLVFFCFKSDQEDNRFGPNPQMIIE